MLDTDVLVIGSGISGLSYAIKVAKYCPDKSIIIVTKESTMDSNTRWAQGGIAVVTNIKSDSYESHIQDTIITGDGLCNEKIVKLVVNEGYDRLKELIAWGTQFDKTDKGYFDLGREGGHTKSRVVHYKDITGLQIEQALVKKALQYTNIRILENHMVIDLITDHHIGEYTNKHNISCYGAYILHISKKEITKITSKLTVLAAGGVGQVYQYTTNSAGSTGDGIGLAYRAKARLKNMQFVQFHPTALYNNMIHNRAFLISEAVRGFGAKLITKSGEKFMHKYDDREELSSRDIVARAIDNELKIRGEEYVLLDCTHLDKNEFISHFPNIYNKCCSIGINPTKIPIPVVPAAHYLCGGISIDCFGQTTIKQLLAIGECACSGLHGANRLASNSLLEGIVFGHRAAIKSIEVLKNASIDKNKYLKIQDWKAEGMHMPEEMVLVKYLKKELKVLLNDLVGIVKTNARLSLASIKQAEIYASAKELYDMSILTPQLLELRNMVATAYLIIEQSKAQKENRGVFYNKDLLKQ